jgi:hypothetical protein
MECDVWDGMADVYLADYPGADRVDVRIKGFVEERVDAARSSIAPTQRGKEALVEQETCIKP